MTPVSSERLLDIWNEEDGDIVKVAKRLGLSVNDLATQVAPQPVLISRRRQPPADLGKEALRPFIVSVRHADHPVWPKDDEVKIEEARAKYEAGTHEMCQQRDRNWFVLFCIPRKKRVGARKFFRTFE